MKTRIFIIATLLSSVIQLNAQEKQNFMVNVGDFTQLLVTDNVNVEYQCNPDSTGYAKFSAVPEMANQIIFSNNKKGKLTVSVGTDSVNAENLPDIIVYSTYLQNADNQGEGTLKVVSVSPAPQLKFKLMGNGAIVVSNIVATSVDLEIFTGKGNITAEGKCTNLNVKNTGTGSVQAERLISENVNSFILGTGKVYCHVNGGRLSVKGSGAGKLYYTGKPDEMKVRQLGSIKALSLDEEVKSE